MEGRNGDYRRTVSIAREIYFVYELLDDTTPNVFLSYCSEWPSQTKPGMLSVQSLSLKQVAFLCKHDTTSSVGAVLGIQVSSNVVTPKVFVLKSNDCVQCRSFATLN